MAENVRVDTRRLDAIMRNLGRNTDEVLGKIAGDLEAYMKDHMSTSSPSPAGDPPGVVTGNLKNSIQARRDRPKHWAVYGADYGLHLEHGTVHMAARPFIRPAVWAIKRNLPRAFRGLVK